MAIAMTIVSLGTTVVRLAPNKMEMQPGAWSVQSSRADLGVRS
jgi:hypothetical protein